MSATPPAALEGAPKEVPLGDAPQEVPLGGAAFARLIEPHRRELKLHCYRMLGSLAEAEDMVQETLLRAWRAHGDFAGRGTLRAWLYRIATNACLDALRGRSARLLPQQRAPASEALPELAAPDTEVPWLEPYPDAQIDGAQGDFLRGAPQGDFLRGVPQGDFLRGVADTAPGPEARVAAAESVRLAFVAALQQLPPRQRAVLLLIDVLGWSAAETATLIGGSAASVNSALQRARDTQARRAPAGLPAAAPVTQAREAELLARYLAAWESLDVEALAALLKEDAVYSMPPAPQWYAGRAAIRAFFGWAFQRYGGFRLLATRANGAPAFAAYARGAGPGGLYTAHSLQVLTLDEAGVAGVTLFHQPGGRLFAAFGLPPQLAADGAGASAPARGRA